MKAFVSGSLAYDRIMGFSGNFSNHILRGKTNAINVSFTVDGTVEKFGGTAGNIAYSLSLLGEMPVVLASIGRDYLRYFEWLAQNRIASDNIKIVSQEFTACAYITTDQSENQITLFNPGAIKHPSEFNLDSVDAQESIFIVSPGNLQDMSNYVQKCKARGIDYIFDPGQSLPMWKAEELVRCIEGAKILISNDYEMEMIIRATGCDSKALLELTEVIIITMGEEGSRVHTTGSEVNIPAVQASAVVDPTGAGDAYRAGLVKGMIQGKAIDICANMGSVCASFAIEHYGTQEHRFTGAEYEERLEKLVSQQ